MLILTVTLTPTLIFYYITVWLLSSNRLLRCTFCFGISAVKVCLELAVYFRYFI